MSNYPPGVTGREYAISGPTDEWEADLECATCGRETLHFFETHSEFGTRAFCNDCSTESDVTEEQDGYDPAEPWMEP